MTTARQTSSNRNSRERRNIIVKIAIMLVLGVVVFVLATIAWFTMNSNVGTGGMGAKVSTMPFEISVRSPYSLRPDYSAIVNSEFGYSSTEHQTGAATDSIKWLMYDETYDPNNPTRGLKPGSHGSFTFNIIPKEVGTYTVYFKILINGYCAEFNEDEQTHILDPESVKQDVNSNYMIQSLNDKIAEKQAEYNDLIEQSNSSQAILIQKELTACEKARDYLKGHLLIYEDCDENGYYSKLIPLDQSFSREFTFTQEQVDNETEIQITLYWIWPNTFGQLILDDGDSQLHDKAMFDSTQTAIANATPREQIIGFICSHPEYYFDSSNENFANSSDLRNFIEGAMGNSPDNLIALSNGYNNADQLIGENMQMLLAEMIVSAVE